MKKLVKLLMVVIVASFMFTGCSDFYDNIATPMYKGVKSGVKNSDINPKTKERLKRISEKVETGHEVREVVKKESK